MKELDKKELKEVEGGTPLFLLWVAFSLGVIVDDLIAGKNEE